VRQSKGVPWSTHVVEEHEEIQHCGRSYFQVRVYQKEYNTAGAATSKRGFTKRKYNLAGATTSKRGFSKGNTTLRAQLLPSEGLPKGNCAY
jgi:hypothetical protein